MEPSFHTISLIKAISITRRFIVKIQHWMFHSMQHTLTTMPENQTYFTRTYFGSAVFQTDGDIFWEKSSKTF